MATVKPSLSKQVRHLAVLRYPVLYLRDFAVASDNDATSASTVSSTAWYGRQRSRTWNGCHAAKILAT